MRPSRQPHRRDSAARDAHVRQPPPHAATWVEALGGAEVVTAATGDHVEPPARGDARGVVARRPREARTRAPAAPGEVVHLEAAERAGVVRAARHVEAAVQHGRGVRGARGGRGRQPAPATRARVVAEQRPGGLGEVGRAPVAAVHVQASAVGHRGGVVERQGHVADGRPAAPPDVVAGHRRHGPAARALEPPDDVDRPPIRAAATSVRSSGEGASGRQPSEPASPGDPFAASTTAPAASSPSTVASARRPPVIRRRTRPGRASARRGSWTAPAGRRPPTRSRARTPRARARRTRPDASSGPPAGDRGSGAGTARR